MPDRDYYLKDDARFKEAREKYRAYLQRLFTLAGSNEAQAKAATETVMRVETRYAQASLDNVALRDPQQTDHKMTFAQLQKLAPAFDWDRYYAATGLTQGDLNVPEPKLMQEFDRQLRETSLADWQTYLRSRVLDSAAPSLSADFVKAEFDVSRGVPQRRARDEAALEALRGGDRRAARRGARPQVRREVFPAARRRRACRSW